MNKRTHTQLRLNLSFVYAAILILCANPAFSLIASDLDSNPEFSKPYTAIRFIGTIPDDLYFSFAIYGICSSNTHHLYQKSIDNQISVHVECPPMGLGDKITVNIAKPHGFNIRFPDESRFNPPEVRYLLVEFTTDEPIDLLVYPMVVMNLFYIDLSGEPDKKALINKLDADMDSLISNRQEFMVYATNYRNPLVYYSTDLTLAPETKNSFLNRLASLNPDPPFGRDDAFSIKEKLLILNTQYNFSRINLFYYSALNRVETYNTLLGSIMSIMPQKNQGEVILLVENHSSIVPSIQFPLSLLRRNQIRYMSF